MSSFNQNIEFTGLVTISTTITAAGPYSVKGQMTIPNLVGGAGASSLVATVNQNGSPVYVGQAGAEGFYTDISCAVNDVIAVVFSSSAAPDLVLNAIKGVISIGQGQ